MARTSTATSSPSPMSATQAAASVALAALLARRRGVKSDGIRRVKRKLKPVSVPVEERERVVERNVRALKKAGRVGESEKEVRRRILKMREEQGGKRKGKGKKVEEDEEDSD